MSGLWFEVREWELISGRWSIFVPNEVDLNRLTPLEALNLLAELKKQIH